MLRFFVNGFLVVADLITIAGGSETWSLPKGYRGLGFPWPLGNFDERRLRINKHHCPVCPEVATEWNGVFEYWQQSLQQGIPARLLLIKTPSSHPKVVPPPETKWKFLGYDIACPGGSWDSAIFNILSEESPLLTFKLWTVHLNSNGLFNRAKDAFEFLMFYESLPEEYDTYIERGVEHTIVGLWELVNIKNL